MTSISFPTIGTGGLGFPKDLVAHLLYGEISEFSQKRQTKRLTEVKIVLYFGDTETQQVKRRYNSYYYQQGFLYCENIEKEV